MNKPLRIAVAVTMDPEMLKSLKTLGQYDFIQGAEVHLVNVFETVNMSHSGNLPAGVYPSNDAFPVIEQGILEQLEKVKQSILPAHSGKVVLKGIFGFDAKTKFTEYAANINADMVVVATRGKRGIEGLFDSSFAQYLSKYSPASVFILRPVRN
jgi:nucleotide-binding universal stress UspA family protein